MLEHVETADKDVFLLEVNLFNCFSVTEINLPAIPPCFPSKPLSLLTSLLILGLCKNTLGDVASRWSILHITNFRFQVENQSWKIGSNHSYCHWWFYNKTQNVSFCKQLDDLPAGSGWGKLCQASSFGSVWTTSISAWPWQRCRSWSFSTSLGCAERGSKYCKFGGLNRLEVS